MRYLTKTLRKPYDQATERKRLSGLGHFEAVAPHGDHILRGAGFRFDATADTSNTLLDLLGGDNAILALWPSNSPNLISGDGISAMLVKQFEDIELFAGKRWG